MKTIPLINRKVEMKYALVDDEDYERLMQWRWYAMRSKGKWYAIRYENHKGFFMHKVISGILGKTEVDHIDGDGLNNTKINLRKATHAENMRNRKLQKNNTSGYAGVSPVYNNKWRAQIKVDGQIKYLGVFENKQDAVSAYSEASKKYFGEFARVTIS